MGRHVTLIGVVTSLVCATCFTTPGRSLSLQEIVGTWNSTSSSENIEIKPNSDVFDYRLGQGRIAPTIENAANFVVAYRGGLYCWYYITLLSDKSLSVAARQGPGGSSQCLQGNFQPAINGEGRAKPFAAIVQ